MPAGLQVFDAAGNLEIDVTTRLTRILGSATVNSTGSVDVPEFAEGSPWYVVTVDPTTPYAEPGITFSGTALSWDYGGATFRATVTIIYGVY
jgi:hypothetical protein